jgi:hypothetical protein
MADHPELHAEPSLPTTALASRRSICKTTAPPASGESFGFLRSGGPQGGPDAENDAREPPGEVVEENGT